MSGKILPCPNEQFSWHEEAVLRGDCMDCCVKVGKPGEISQETARELLAACRSAYDYAMDGYSADTGNLRRVIEKAEAEIGRG